MTESLSAAAHAGAAPAPGPAGGGARAGVRRSLRRREELPVLLQASRALDLRTNLLLIGGEREARPAATSRAPYRRDSLELAQWIASADALVHAGTKETFGLVLLEAMACGRPVVAARAGAFPELVDDSVGVLARPTAPAHGEAIAALLRARPRRRRCRRPCPRAQAVHLAACVPQPVWRIRVPGRRPPAAGREAQTSSWVHRLRDGERLTVSAAARAAPQGPHGWRRARARLSRASA